MRDNEGFGAMGKPIPTERVEAAYIAAKEMGLPADKAMYAVTTMAEQLKRDKPFEAMQMAGNYLDLTGVYRLMSYLLTGPAK